MCVCVCFGNLVTLTTQFMLDFVTFSCSNFVCTI